MVISRPEEGLPTCNCVQSDFHLIISLSNPENLALVWQCSHLRRCHERIAVGKSLILPHFLHHVGCSRFQNFLHMARFSTITTEKKQKGDIEKERISNRYGEHPSSIRVLAVDCVAVFRLVLLQHFLINNYKKNKKIRILQDWTEDIHLLPSSSLVEIIMIKDRFRFEEGRLSIHQCRCVLNELKEA